MSKLAKFFIICAIVFCVGLGLAVGGICSGGVSGIDKVSEDHSWVVGSPGKMVTEKTDCKKFDSVEATGNIDLIMIGTEFRSESDEWKISDAMMKSLRGEMPKEGSVVIVHGKNVESPDCNVENGVLKIQGPVMDGGAISLNLTDKDATPEVMVFCGDRKMNNIKVSNNDCDVVAIGLTFENAELYVSDGDVNMEYVRSSGLKIDGDCTDIDLQGNFYGNTEIKTVDGDVDMATNNNQDEYSVEIYSEDGDVEVNDKEIEAYDDITRYNSNGGSNRIIIKNSCGDVDLFFGDKLY